MWACEGCDGSWVTGHGSRVRRGQRGKRLPRRVAISREAIGKEALCAGQIRRSRPAFTHVPHAPRGVFLSEDEAPTRARLALTYSLTHCLYARFVLRQIGPLYGLLRGSPEWNCHERSLQNTPRELASRSDKGIRLMPPKPIIFASV